MSNSAWRKVVILLLMDRDGSHCHYCERDLKGIDHKIAQIRGGAVLNPSNLVLSCQRCNYEKGAQDYGMYKYISERRVMGLGLPMGPMTEPIDTDMIEAIQRARRGKSMKRSEVE